MKLDRQQSLSEANVKWYLDRDRAIQAFNAMTVSCKLIQEGGYQILYFLDKSENFDISLYNNEAFILREK